MSKKIKKLAGNIFGAKKQTFSAGNIFGAKKRNFFGGKYFWRKIFLARKKETFLAPKYN
jgi:hypothetical protein